MTRTDERLSEPYLARLAQTLPGKSLMLHHDTHRVPVGLVYAARVREAMGVEPGSVVFEADFFMRVGPENEELRRQIDAGGGRYRDVQRHRQLVCEEGAGQPGVAARTRHEGRLAPTGTEVGYLRHSRAGSC